MLPYDRLTSPRQAYFRMKGEDVFAFTLAKGPEIIRKLLSESEVSLADVKTFICHQANIHILHGIADRLDVPRESFFVNLDRLGNTASASVLIAFDQAIAERRLAANDLVVLAAFGGGLSWGANLVRL